METVQTGLDIRQRQKISKRARMKRYLFLYLLLLPAILLTIIFNYLPMAGILIAFQDFNIFKGFLGSPFVGFDNFIHVFNLPKFFDAFKNTVFYSFVISYLGFPLPIILAILFNELRNGWFKRLAQTVSYFPHFISWIAVVSLFYTFFSMDGTYNMIRQLILGPEAEKINILMDPNWFLPNLFISNLWKEIGWCTIIFLAAINGIDAQLYEAAIIDGCGRFKRIWHITVPGILPTTMVIFIMSAGSIISANFEQVYGFQNLYVQEQTEIIGTLIYRSGVLNGEFSMATAFGLAQGVASFLIVFVTNRISKKLTEVTIW